MEVREGMSNVVLTLGPGHTLRDAATRMVEKGVGAAIVVDDEYPGPRIISERDILNSLGKGEDPDSESVGEHMSDTLIAAAPDWSLERAAMEMSKRHIRHLVVIESGDLVGILSMRDIVRVWTTEGATSGMTSPESEATGVPRRPSGRFRAGGAGPGARSGTAGSTAVLRRCSRGRRATSSPVLRTQARSAASRRIAPATA